MLNARSVEQQQLPTISVNVTDQASQLRCADLHRMQRFYRHAGYRAPVQRGATPDVYPLIRLHGKALRTSRLAQSGDTTRHGTA